MMNGDRGVECMVSFLAAFFLVKTVKSAKRNKGNGQRGKRAAGCVFVRVCAYQLSHAFSYVDVYMGWPALE